MSRYVKWFVVIAILVFGTITISSIPIQAQSGGCDPNSRMSSFKVEGTTYNLSISGDGRYVVFDTYVSIVPQDVSDPAWSTNKDVYVYDRTVCQFELISKTATGNSGNSDSEYPSISRDGRYVAFLSRATNLAGNVNSGRQPQLYLYDRVSQSMTIVSHTYNQPTTPANNGSAFPVISGNGQYIAYTTTATDIVASPQGTLYIYDRLTGQNSSIESALGLKAGQSLEVWQTDSLSFDGRFIGFTGKAHGLPQSTTNYVDALIVDRTNRQVILPAVASDGTVANDSSVFPDISADGRYVAFISSASNLVSGDTNKCGGNAQSCNDVFVHDLTTGQTVRVSVSSTGAQSTYPYTDTINYVSISGDGRYVVFPSSAVGLTSNDTNNHLDIFVHDLTTHQTLLVSAGQDGSAGNGDSDQPAISDDGELIAFTSTATNLTPAGAGTVFFAHRSAITTPTPTPTPVPVMTDRLKVQYKPGTISGMTNQIKPYFKIVNTGSTAVPLNELTVRYWYTYDITTYPAPGQQAECDYAIFDCSNLKTQFHAIANPASNANYYIEYSFTQAAGDIQPWETSSVILTRINLDDWETGYNQYNDYSFDYTPTTYVDAPRITLYRNGILIWGTEPTFPASTSTPTSTTTPAQSTTATPTFMPPTP